MIKDMSPSQKSSEVHRGKEFHKLAVAGGGGRPGNAWHAPGRRISIQLNLFSGYPVATCGMGLKETWARVLKGQAGDGEGTQGRNTGSLEG